MLEIFKKEKTEKYLNVPTLHMPKEGEINMNGWIQEHYRILKENFDEGVKPLEFYLEKFNELLPIIQMKPE